MLRLWKFLAPKGNGERTAPPTTPTQVKSDPNRSRSESLSPVRAVECQRHSLTDRRLSFARRASDFSDIQHMTELSEGIQLSDRQKSLIRRAWGQVNQRGEPGKWVVRRLFTRYPEIRQVFGLGSDKLTLKQLDSNPIFLKHSQVFQDLLEMIVGSLDALDDCLGPLLISYGCRHVSFEQKFGFKLEMWQTFADVMCQMGQHWRLGAAAKETRMAWRILILFVVTKVRQGFEAEKHRGALEDATAL